MKRFNKNVCLMYAIALFQGMVFYGPIATLYRTDRGLTIFQIMLIESISLAVMILLEIPWGAVADRIGYKKTILICNVLYFLSKIVFWKATDFTMFLTERLMLSVILSGLSGCDTAYLHEYAGGREHRVFSVYNSMSVFGLVMASLAFSLFIRDNANLAAQCTVISYGISFFLTLFLRETPHENVGHTVSKDAWARIFSDLRENKSFLLFLLGTSLLAETNQSVTVFLNQLQYVKSGIALGDMGYLSVIITCCGMVGVFSSKLHRILGERRFLLILFCGAAFACLLMGMLPIAVVSVAGMGVLRASSALMTPFAYAVQNRQVHLASRATVLSVYSFVMNLTAVFTNLLFGRISEFSVASGLYLGAVFVTVGYCFCITWSRTQ